MVSTKKCTSPFICFFSRYVHASRRLFRPSCQDRQQPQQLVLRLHDITQSISLHLLMRGKTLPSSWSSDRLIIRCQNCMQRVSQRFMYVLAFFQLHASSYSYTPILIFLRKLGTSYYLLIRLVWRLPTAKSFKSSAACFAHLPEFLTS